VILINSNDKKRIIDFINHNKLDYILVDNNISKFHIISHDNIKFFFYTYNDEYVVVKYDPNKDKDNQPGSMPYEYFNFKTLLQVLEQLKYYDDGLHKSYWYSTTNSAEIGFDKNSYKEDWYEDFKREVDYSMLQDDDFGYQYLVYDNPNYSLNIKSPYNTLSQVSPLNYEQEAYIKVNKLYFEIHPISCQDGNESYLLKLLANNEEVLKEFINYIVTKKRGLKILIEEIFKSIKK
jgi:hypothetical protein